MSIKGTNEYTICSINLKTVEARIISCDEKLVMLTPEIHIHIFICSMLIYTGTRRKMLIYYFKMKSPFRLLAPQ